jgi:DNA invertase Pin-like site-specific DNA recombinase
MKIAYLRVSTTDQNTELQLDAIKKHHEIDKVFEEKASGRNDEREELKKALEYCRAGDSLVVYKLDRLARSTVKLISVLNDLRDRQVELISISENIDTSTSAGRALFGMLAVFAEFEASVIRERTNAGLAAARARGVSLGRTKTDKKILEKALKLYDARSHTIREISEITGVSRSVLYREIANRGNP